MSVRRVCSFTSQLIRIKHAAHNEHESTRWEMIFIDWEHAIKTRGNNFRQMSIIFSLIARVLSGTKCVPELERDSQRDRERESVKAETSDCYLLRDYCLFLLFGACDTLFTGINSIGMSLLFVFSQEKCSNRLNCHG